MKQYILDGKTPVLEPDRDKWARWFEKGSHHVARTMTARRFFISTVFLGIDHQWGKGPPLLFETMVFERSKNTDLDMKRYSTWDEAEAGHAALVRKWRAKLKWHGS